MYTHTTLYVRIYVYIGDLISRSLSSSTSCFQASIPQFYPNVPRFWAEITDFELHTAVSVLLQNLIHK